MAWTLGISTLISLVIFAVFVHGFKNDWIAFDKKHVDLTRLEWILEEVKAERYKLQEELIESNRKIRKLENSELSLRKRIEELEEELLKYHRRDDLPTTPLLLICGDKGFCTEDTTQLNRARVWFRTLENASKRDVVEELSRRRQNNDLYPWVHVAAHGGKDGIMLADGIASPSWWSSQLEGIKIIFAANCESVEVGDALAGVVDFVIVFYGDRNSEDVSRFTYGFWSAMMKDSDVRKAYRQSLASVPSLRPFVDLRTR